MKHREIITSFIFSVLITFGLSGIVFAQNLPSEMIKAFESGNAKQLSNHFNREIKINLLDTEFNTDIKEAENLMQRFFNNNPPVSFTSKFESKKNNSGFVIATLTTESKKFRINIFYRNENGKNLIHLLRIEHENETTF